MSKCLQFSSAYFITIECFLFLPFVMTPHSPSSTDSKSRKEKLEQVASFSLFGNVMSMASVQLVGASRDALLLSFKDAKVSLSKLCTASENFKQAEMIFY